ncbi:hypothetical protein CWC48_05225 [Pseudomonas sp. S10E 269]|uniref:DUF1120 domain-containing protein n=1 Tax=unclassified Pseudomonas TaxID=196821 RepID=UPI000C2652E9|nr:MULTISPECIES: DUF1120 domain-containing protein [unclassified Pseudomonas]MBT1259384.1 DUF1120 domain-containing protein [Pseudomonas sp. VS40]MBT1270980.1 DUF1120 domain-containing protein [Pseudomonas sp. VS59]PJK34617.1 hypothetical protein CWC49_15385 [Pseudomonas sp. S09F 262]PJK38559.1 hypothetical protein CWC48_05225 [Pseudomonas sp. S10E 269]
MKAIQIPLAACVGLACALQAQAASTVDLSVSGVITPSACTPSLSNGGVYDLGKLAAKDLNSDQPTRLPASSLHFAINCEAMTLLALEPKDNRLGSSYSEYSSTFGLGLAGNNAKIGFLQITLESVVADDVDMNPIGSTGPDTWAPSAVLSHHFLTAFTPDQTHVPAAIQHLTGDLQFIPYLAPTNTLPLTEEVHFEASATLSIKYL